MGFYSPVRDCISSDNANPASHMYVVLFYKLQELKDWLAHFDGDRNPERTLRVEMYMYLMYN